VFENTVLRRLCGPKKDEVKGKCGKVLNEEFYDNTPYQTIQVIRSRGMRWAGHAGEERCMQGFGGIPEG
jgi:hypothetical protein